MYELSSVSVSCVVCDFAEADDVAAVFAVGVFANAVMRRKDDQNQTKGTKPANFCYWLFGLWNLKPHDTLVDIYPGSGAVMAAWETWKRQGSLFAPNDSSSATRADSERGT